MSRREHCQHPRTMASSVSCVMSLSFFSVAVSVPFGVNDWYGIWLVCAVGWIVEFDQNKPQRRRRRRRPTGQTTTAACGVWAGNARARRTGRTVSRRRRADVNLRRGTTRRTDEERRLASRGTTTAAAGRDKRASGRASNRISWSLHSAPRETKAAVTTDKSSRRHDQGSDSEN